MKEVSREKSKKLAASTWRDLNQRPADKLVNTKACATTPAQVAWGHAEFWYCSFPDKKEKWVPVEIPITTGKHREGRTSKSASRPSSRTADRSKNWRDDAKGNGFESNFNTDCSFNALAQLTGCCNFIEKSWLEIVPRITSGILWDGEAIPMVMGSCPRPFLRHLTFLVYSATWMQAPCN